MTGIKGPLEDGWQDKVEAFAAAVAHALAAPNLPGEQARLPPPRRREPCSHDRSR